MLWIPDTCPSSYQISVTPLGGAVFEGRVKPCPHHGQGSAEEQFTGCLVGNRAVSLIRNASGEIHTVDWATMTLAPPVPEGERMTVTIAAKAAAATLDNAAEIQSVIDALLGT